MAIPISGMIKKRHLATALILVIGAVLIPGAAPEIAETLRMVLPEQSASGMKPGDEVPIAIDLNKIHIFRAASGQVMT